MDFLSLTSGKNFGLSKLKAGIKINSDNEFLRKYDANQNSIFDAEELKQFQQDIMPYIEDGELDSNEAISLYAKVMNMTVEKVRELFKNDNNIIDKSFELLMYEVSKQEAVEKMESESSNALEVYTYAMKGPASKVANEVKELFNTEYAGDKVYRQIVKSKISSELIKLAYIDDSSISLKSYLKIKSYFLKYLLNENMNQDDIDLALEYITPSDMEDYIEKLVNAEDNEYPSAIDSVIKDIKSKTPSNISDSANIAFKNRINPSSIKGIMDSSQGEKLLKFEDIYALENRIEFNKENIDDYSKKEKEFQIILNIYNRAFEIKEVLNQPTTILDGINRGYSTNNTSQEFALKQASENLNRAIMDALLKICNNNEGAIINYLSSIGFDNAKIVNNRISFDGQGDESYRLVALSNAIKNNLDDSINNVLGDKSLEEHANELKSKHNLAYGQHNPINLAEKFQDSQETGAGYVKMAATSAGMIVSLASGGVEAPIVQYLLLGTGMLVSMSSGAAITAAENKAKNGSLTEEDKKEILKELTTSGLFMATGMGIGKTSAQLGMQLLSKNCPKFLAAIAEYGSDFGMSLLTDYIITGQLDLSGESLSELINIAQGIVTHKKLAKAHPHNKTEHAELETKIKDPQNAPKGKIGTEGISNDEVEVTLIGREPGTEITSEMADRIISIIEKYPAEYEDLSVSVCKFRTINDIEQMDLLISKYPDYTKEILEIYNKKDKFNSPYRDASQLEHLSLLLEKYPQQAENILKIVDSNNNIKLGQDLIGQLSTEIDDIISLINEHPNLEKQIVEYASVQRYRDYDTRLSTRELTSFIDILKRFPDNIDEVMILAKNPNLDTVSIQCFMHAISKNNSTTQDLDAVLYFAQRGFDENGIARYASFIKRHPEMKSVLCNDSLEIDFIDKSVTTTDMAIITKRASLREELETRFPEEMNTLKNTLGTEFFYKAKFEELFPNGIQNDAKEIMDLLNDSCKFFARIASNEVRYGKNLIWANQMNNISEVAQVYIKDGNLYIDEVMDVISTYYHNYDVATTLDYQYMERNDRRICSGIMEPRPYATTAYNRNNYGEYYHRFQRIANKERNNPYSDINLTKICSTNDDSGTMIHPGNEDGNTTRGMAHVQHNYDAIRPLIEKVKQGGTLTKEEIGFANDNIAEIYFIIANIMPYSRGSNGIADILMRSIYKSLGINQPAIKQGISLDLESFCLDLDDYKKNWNNFFETK